VFVRFYPFGGEGWWRFGAGAGRVLVGADDVTKRAYRAGISLT
jgi:hypothetical protein